MTGYKDASGELQHSIGVYYVSKSNFGIGQKVDEFTDLSFLKKGNFDSFIEKVKLLKLTQEEIDKIKSRREQEITASLVKLNNDIYQNEKGLSESARVYLVAASIMATLGVPEKVSVLEKSDLKSSSEVGNRDGDIVLRKIIAFLNEKNLPEEKRNMIVRTLQNTLTTDNINKVENAAIALKYSLRLFQPNDSLYSTVIPSLVPIKLAFRVDFLNILSSAISDSGLIIDYPSLKTTV